MLVASQTGFADLKVVRKRRIPFVAFLRGVSSRGSTWTALPWALVPMLGDAALPYLGPGIKYGTRKVLPAHKEIRNGTRGNFFFLI